MIPKQLQKQNLRFTLVKKGGKAPYEKGWQKTSNYTYDDNKLLSHLKRGGNYGVLCGRSNLVIIDFDNDEFQKQKTTVLPETFTVKSGGKGLLHFYYFLDEPINKTSITDEKGQVLADIQGIKSQCIGPGSTHESGKKYVVNNTSDIKKLTKTELFKLFPEMQQHKKQKNSFKEIKTTILCPFHEDHNPSMQIYKDGSGFCFACNSSATKEAIENPQNAESRINNRGGKHHFLYDNTNLPEQFKKILDNPELLNLINTEFDKKIEGEHEARKTIYLTLNMRNVENLNEASDNLMINDSGGMGKDYLVKSICKILPLNELEKRTRITPKVLVYMNDIKTNPAGWTKKALYLEDVPNQVLNDDAFKVMCSADPNGITQTSFVDNGKLRNLNIKGKPSIIITIAETNPKFELLRRFPILNLTSTPEQTKAILRKQSLFAMTGQSPDYNQEIIQAQRFLRRVKVKIPYADKLAEVFPFQHHIVRTHYPRFLDIIRSSCSLYQYQREKDSEGFYLATEQDYENARAVIKATTTNALMIPLDKVQKTILEQFNRLQLARIDDVVYSFNELYEMMQNLAGERTFRRKLNKMVEMGLLKTTKRKVEGGFQHESVYSIKQLTSLELPTYKNLSTLTSLSNKSNMSNRANRKKNASPLYLSSLTYLTVDNTNNGIEKNYLHSEVGSENGVGIASLPLPTSPSSEEILQHINDIGGSISFDDYILFSNQTTEEAKISLQKFASSGVLLESRVGDWRLVR